ncbi:MAG: hypothetical protein KDJ16_02050 [Hyphomicrobiales bacterium]|nr:hypothetical protein [Hyphomicrobiales bacterium]
MHRRNFMVAAALLALGSAVAPIRAEEQNRISGPFVHENLAVYFVHGASAPGPVPLTLAEALADKTVEVTETGNVQELTIENRGDKPVFIQLGDIVKGGKQDRVLYMSFLLPPKSGPLPIGAYCVEQGRWSKRGSEDVASFSDSERMVPSRAAKLALSEPTADADISSAGGWSQSALLPGASRQSVIWESVASTQDKLSAAIGDNVASSVSSSSLQLALENKELNRKVDAFVAALEERAKEADDIVGFVFAVNGRINSGDVYPSNGLFMKMWPKLLRAAATEALGAGEATVASAPIADRIAAFINAADSGDIREDRIVNDIRVERRGTEETLKTETTAASGAVLHKSYIVR